MVEAETPHVMHESWQMGFQGLVDAERKHRACELIVGEKCSFVVRYGQWERRADTEQPTREIGSLIQGFLQAGDKEEFIQGLWVHQGNAEAVNGHAQVESGQGLLAASRCLLCGDYSVRSFHGGHSIASLLVDSRFSGIAFRYELPGSEYISQKAFCDRTSNLKRPSVPGNNRKM
jgi:hypothetical protein